uniref:Cercosporin MFS transporter CTB4 (Cercosporin toxin biosynthesis cluster protein 4) n=1 Tax=Ganoderma boninense TaxID=34458 RepID=A0A5K1K718_9APHY|nr:Cercosporin MFS transporter CTB4 (Cercosporin toxin biosynthesis cluster protein 4) [Ganoderma boninense]
MAPPDTKSLFSQSDLGSLLALLEFARGGNDPIDEPIPWVWESWRQGLRCEYAPWQANATREKTHMLDYAKHHSRCFVAAYHASAWEISDRVRFATDLTEHDGELYKGREWLTLWWRWQRYGDLMNLEEKINDIFIKAGVIRSSRSVADLDIGILMGDPHPVFVLGRGLFGEETWLSGHSRHPAVLRWLKHTLDMTRRDWLVLHDDVWQRVDRMRQMVYTMCQAVAGYRCAPGDISGYVVKLGYMIETMDFLRTNGRMEQVVHYRKILYAIRDCMGSWGEPSTSPLLPPNMCRVLASLPTVSYRNMIQSDVTKCLKMLDIRANRAPVFSIDVYDVLSSPEVGFLAGDFGVPDGMNREDAGLAFTDEDAEVGLEFARITLPRVW